MVPTLSLGVRLCRPGITLCEQPCLQTGVWVWAWASENLPGRGAWQSWASPVQHVLSCGYVSSWPRQVSGQLGTRFSVKVDVSSQLSLTARAVAGQMEMPNGRTLLHPSLLRKPPREVLCCPSLPEPPRFTVGLVTDRCGGDLCPEDLKAE